MCAACAVPSLLATQESQHQTLQSVAQEAWGRRRKVLQHQGVSYRHLGLVCAPYTGLWCALTGNFFRVLLIYCFNFIL